MNNDLGPDSQRFSYTQIQNIRGEVALRPQLPITLAYNGRVVHATGLLDTGADVNVLPFHIGVALGIVWSDQTTSLTLSGNLANYEARGVILTAVVGSFASVPLAFAWTRSEQVPLLLGQINFFMTFNVCFFRSQNIFEVRPPKTM